MKLKIYKNCYLGSTELVVFNSYDIYVEMLSQGNKLTIYQRKIIQPKKNNYLLKILFVGLLIFLIYNLNMFV